MKEIIEENRKRLVEEHARLMSELQNNEQIKSRLTERLLGIKGAVAEYDKLRTQLTKELLEKNIKKVVPKDKK